MKDDWQFSSPPKFSLRSSSPLNSGSHLFFFLIANFSLLEIYISHGFIRHVLLCASLPLISTTFSRFICVVLGVIVTHRWIFHSMLTDMWVDSRLELWRIKLLWLSLCKLLYRHMFFFFFNFSWENIRRGTPVSNAEFASSFLRSHVLFQRGRATPPSCRPHTRVPALTAAGTRVLGLLSLGRPRARVSTPRCVFTSRFLSIQWGRPCLCAFIGHSDSSYLW